MRRRKTAVWLLLSFAIFPSLIAHAKADNARKYDVPPNLMAKALVEFAKQSDISIVRPPLSYRDGKANRLKGQFTLKEGLSQLLKNTGFSFKILSPTAVKVMRGPQKPSPSHPPRKALSLSPPVMEEITVSSTRRTDYADKLPYSLSVLSGAALENLFGGSTNDAAVKLAGLSATNQGESRNKIIIRGLSDGSFSGRTQALVATYLDEARMVYNAPEPGFSLIDIASIEVLRGPQGTLYGSGALGGIYRVVTNKPVFDYFGANVTASIKATEGGSLSHSNTIMLNIPLLEDRLAVRGVAYYEKNGGYIDNVRLGLDNVNSRVLYGGRFTASLNLWDWLNVKAGINFQHHISDDTNYYNGALKPYNRDNYTRENSYDVLTQPYFTLSADLSWANITSNLSWLNRDLDNFYDGTLAVTKLSTLTQTVSRFEDDRYIKTISSETHLTSKEGARLEWLGGLFLSHRHENLLTKFQTPGSAQIAGYGPTDTLFSEKLTENLNEIALFGETTYFLTERFSLTGGLRWFHYSNSALSILDDVGFGHISEARGQQEKSGLIPKFTLSFYANDRQLYYLQIAEGYRLGGINLKGPTLIKNDSHEEEKPDADKTALTTFDSDKLLNAELGFKHQLLDGRFILNGAAFFTNWKNIQSDQYNVSGLPIVGNIGSGYVIGGEIEMIYHPDQALQFQANIAWNSSELTKVNNVFGRAVGAVKNEPLPGAPAFTMNFSGQYDFTLNSDMSGMLGLSYSYVGAANLLYKADAYKQSDAYHLGRVHLEINRGNWRATVFIDNLFNTKANSFAFGNPFSLNELKQVTPLRPRSYGLRIAWVS